MDFSRLRKIFYIVCIISMLLSIKSKVFGLTFNYNNVIYDNNTFTTSQYPYFMVCLNTNGTFYHIIQSDEPISYVMDMSDKYLRTTGIDSSNNCYYYSMPIESFNEYDFSNYNYGTLETSDFQFRFSNSNENYIYSNYDIYVDGSSVHSADDSQYLQTNPFFDNATEIEKGNPDGVYISAADFSNTDNLYFHLLQINTGLANSDQSIYYYSDKTFILNKDSDYYKTWADPSIEGFYYYIPRYKLGLSQNTSYLYVLNNSKNQIQNSQGIYEKDSANGIYDVIQSDTAGVITATEEESDRMKNIEQSLIQNQGSIENIQNSLNDTNVSQDTETNIDTSLNFNNSAPQFSSLFNGYFSRLTSIISDLGNYQDTDVISVSIPIPFTNDTIPISSNFIFSNQNNTFLKNLAATLWYFIFGRYFLYFLINIYWSITNGQFFKSYLTQKEAITSDML